MLPATFTLAPAQPNPFNPSTAISYEVPHQVHITITEYNILGQSVVNLVDQLKATGSYIASWHGKNERGAGVASGIYVYRLTSSTGFSETKRMTLLK